MATLPEDDNKNVPQQAAGTTDFRPLTEKIGSAVAAPVKKLLSPTESPLLGFGDPGKSAIPGMGTGTSEASVLDTARGLEMSKNAIPPAGGAAPVQPAVDNPDAAAAPGNAPAGTEVGGLPAIIGETAAALPQFRSQVTPGIVDVGGAPTITNDPAKLGVPVAANYQERPGGGGLQGPVGEVARQAVGSMIPGAASPGGSAASDYLNTVLGSGGGTFGGALQSGSTSGILNQLGFDSRSIQALKEAGGSLKFRGGHTASPYISEINFGNVTGLAGQGQQSHATGVRQEAMSTRTRSTQAGQTARTIATEAGKTQRQIQGQTVDAAGLAVPDVGAGEEEFQGYSDHLKNVQGAIEAGTTPATPALPQDEGVVERFQDGSEGILERGSDGSLVRRDPKTGKREKIEQLANN